MSIPLEASIVRIFAADGSVVGTGFLVGEMTVLTCAHVVATALEVAADVPKAPELALSLDFPLVASGRRLSAQVILWQPIQTDNSGDIAMLRLNHAPPDGAKAAHLVIAEDLWEHPFRVFGFPENHDQGVWATGRLRAGEATGWIQIEDIKTTGKSVQRGFSGGAIWDEQREGIVGMVVATDEDASRVAYMIPAKILREAIRRVDEGFMPIIQVFISYAGDGHGLAQQLSRDLKKEGIQVWMDQPEISADEPSVQSNEDAIKRSAFLLLIVTPLALESPTVQKDLVWAQQNRVHIILLCHRNIEEFPLSLSHLHYIQFPYESQFEDLYKKNFSMLYDVLQGNNLSVLPIIPPSNLTPQYREYLDSVIDHLRELPLIVSKSIMMDTIWTSIDVEYRESAATNPIRIPALEAISTHERLLILGNPGSGKSSLIRYVALCLASAALQDITPITLSLSNIGPYWRRGPLCPVYVELFEFALHGLRSPNPLFAFIVEQAQRCSFEFGEELRRKMKNRACIILLDGLDEVPDEARQNVLDSIQELSRTTRMCPIVITGRTYISYQVRRQLPGFKEIIIAPFLEYQIETFLEKWYRNLLPQLDPYQESSIKMQLKERIKSDPLGLGELAQVPLLLTFIANVYTLSADALPKSRSGLYEKILQLMLKEWEAKHTHVDKETGQLQQVPSELAKFLREPWAYELILQMLQKLAYDAQVEQKNAHGVADISRGKVANSLDELIRKGRGEEAEVDVFRIEYDIRKRAGLLQPYGDKFYRFPHRTIQEFLAACYLCRKEYYPYELQKQIYEDPEQWREVLMFVADIVVTQLGKACLLPLFDALLSEPNTAQCNPQAIHFAVHHCGLLLTKYNLLDELSKKTNYWSRMIEDIRQGLLSIIDQRALTPVTRAHVARTLATLGDNRLGVALRQDRLPDIVWCRIPAGPFVFGVDGERNSGSQHFDLPAFWIGRYPITNAQFQPFIEDGGYSERWRECWTDAGWEWIQRPGRARPYKLTEPFSLSNHPRVGIDFFEAVAYSHWLSKRFGFEVRLPYELEWEKAARGTEGLRYPWGNKFEPDAANILTAQINSTCAVGLFPPGVYEVYDLIGNISEWTLTPWDVQYASHPNYMDSDPEGEYPRVLRGAAYTYSVQKAVTTYRHWEDPQDRLLTQGFRLVTATNPYL